MSHQLTHKTSAACVVAIPSNAQSPALKISALAAEVLVTEHEVRSLVHQVYSEEQQNCLV